MRTFRWMTALAALALAACGSSGSDFATPPGGGGGGTGSTVSTVVVTSTAASIPTDGSVLATITALAKDANNNAVSGANVTFSSNAGSLVVTQAKTDTNGVATATLSGSGVASGSSITVTATASSISGNVGVLVVNTQRTLSLVTNVPQIPSDGSSAANISALVRDANNNVVSGATVLFQATSGSLTVTQAQTDATGIAKATLASGSDPTNRSVKVTATSGTATANITVQVKGTTLTITGPANLIQGQSGTYAVVLANSGGQGISGAVVGVTSANGNTLSTPAVTDVSGHTNFNLTAAVGGQDTITASALGLQQQTGVQVSSDNFAITAPTNNSKVNLGISQLVTVTWIHNGTPFAGQTVNIAATRGSVVPVSPASLPLITDANGQVQVSISSGSAGPGIVSATGTGVSAQLTLDFVAVTPSQVSLQAGPATVAVGAQSTISATVRDVANNLVEGATVDFLLSADPTNGSLQSASVVTNALGVAQTVYAAGTTSSGANGVVISATVRGAAIPPSTTYPAKTFVTVGGQTVFLSLGTGNTIDTSKGAAVYQITYTVFAVDATGAAQANVPIALSVLPVAYGKGFMSGCPGGTNWFANYTTPTNDAFAYNATKMCRNEDSDYTGNINSLVGKDYNTNGRLDPGNIAVVSPGSGSTDSAGRLDVTVTYPRDHSYWVQVALVAKTNVSGTESSATSTFVLQGAITDYACGVGPPGPVSPYGQAATCANPN